MMEREEKPAELKGVKAALIGLLSCSLAMSLIYLLRVLDGAGKIGLADAGDAVVSSAPFIALLTCVSVSVVCLVARMLAVASRSSSPFSDEQAQRLIVLGGMLAACALLEAVAVGFAPGPSEVEIITILGSKSKFGAVNIEILLIVTAFVSFYLSYLFKYASFLQWCYDETF